MTKTNKKINIACIIYNAYPHADLLPIDPEQDCRNLNDLLAKVTGENIGDGLFRFIVVEIVEGGESSMDGAIRVMERARDDVEAVLQALQLSADDKNDKKPVETQNPEIELLEACKVLTSYTTDLLYRLDNQINIADVEEIQQAKDAIARYSRFIANQS